MRQVQKPVSPTAKISHLHSDMGAKHFEKEKDFDIANGEEVKEANKMFGAMQDYI